MWTIVYQFLQFIHFLNVCKWIHVFIPLYSVHESHGCAALSICLPVLAESSSSTHMMEDTYMGSSISLHDSVEADNILTISGAHTTGSSTALSNSITTSAYVDSKMVSLKIISQVSKFYIVVWYQNSSLTFSS